MNAYNLLALESASAALAATLDARPPLGALWRRIVGLSEACAHLSLEDLPVREDDVLRPPLGLGQIQGEPQSARIARGIYSHILRPKDLRSDPEAAFHRAVRVAWLPSYIDDGRGGHVLYITEQEQEDWAQAGRDFARAIPGLLSSPGSPFITSIAIAAIAGAVMPEALPGAERLIFLSAEHTLRSELSLSGPVQAASVEGLDPAPAARWVFTPSLALSRDGFRAWSSQTPSGRQELVDRLLKSLNRDVGRLAQMEAWYQKCQDFSGQRSRSRKSDIARLMQSTPILNSDAVAHALGITPRGALNLLNAAEEAQLLVPITTRHHYRQWAVPAMSDMLRERGRLRSPSQAATQAADSVKPDPMRQPLPHDDDFDRRVEEVFSVIDDAISGIDALLERSSLIKAD